MAVTARTAPEALLTYEAYMAEPELHRRFEILDGVRLFMTNPNRFHQRIQFRIAQAFDRFEASTHTGQMIQAPCDILIRRDPLRTRQPDIPFISHERLGQCPPPVDPAPLPIGPELVVEILSPSETRRSITRKLADYRSVGVQEVWIVDPEAQAVEVLRLTAREAETIETVGRGGEVRSEAFPGLVASIDAIFDV